MDKFTKERSRIGFAKVCMEFNVEKSYMDEFDMALPNGEVIKINVQYV